MSFLDNREIPKQLGTPPPLRPRSEVDKERCKEILRAMLRYMEADIVPPGEWQGELMERMNRVRNDQAALAPQVSLTRKVSR